MPKTFTLSEVAEHNSAESLWVAINNHVYDVTAFRSMHPGGGQLLLQAGGQDATVEAQSAHGTSRKAQSLMSKYCIGKLAIEEEQFDPTMENRKAACFDLDRIFFACSFAGEFIYSVIDLVWFDLL